MAKRKTEESMGGSPEGDRLLAEKLLAQLTPIAERIAVQACPTFTLRADQKGHLRALMAALPELPDSELAQGLRTLREFDLWEEAHR